MAENYRGQAQRKPLHGLTSLKAAQPSAFGGCLSRMAPPQPRKQGPTESPRMRRTMAWERIKAIHADGFEETLSLPNGSRFRASPWFFDPTMARRRVRAAEPTGIGNTISDHRHIGWGYGDCAS